LMAWLIAFQSVLDTSDHVDRAAVGA